MNKKLCWLMALVLALNIISCAKKSNKTTIAVIPKGATHEFWKSVHAGAVKAAGELNVDIIWKGPQKEDDRSQQITVVEDFITRQVDGIILAPLDDKALVKPVEEAISRNIPVVIIDSGIKSDKIVSFIATDNYQGGILAGEKLAQLLNKKGKVLLVRYQEGSDSTTNREKGFIDAVKKYPGIKIVAEQYGGATTESAYKIAENMINANPGFNGIFCCNESTTFGTLRALEDSGKAGKVKFVGFDSSKKLVEALSRNVIQGLIVQNPMKMGELGVKTIMNHINKVQVEKRVDTGVVVATPENMNNPEIKQVLEPDFSKYLK